MVNKTNSQSGLYQSTMPTFLQPSQPITNIAAQKNYDIVVIGAGSPGLPCALKAAELGAKVAVIQKEATAAANGNFGSGIDLEHSNPADIESLVSLLIQASADRPKREVVEIWAQNSGEAISWLIKKATLAKAQIKNLGTTPHQKLLQQHNYHISFVTSFFGPKPYDTGAGMKDLANLAIQEGVDIYYSCPAQQLVKTNNRVSGVIAKQNNEYLQFNAHRGVVVATGDYQNDEAMRNYYLPDVKYLANKRTGRTGDGHKMIVWAGGQIENIAHTKMCHDMDSGPMFQAPFLRVKMNGKRFCNETRGMEVMANYLLSPEDHGQYCQIFDSAYLEKFATFGG